jgi:hypothetical protein
VEYYWIIGIFWNIMEYYGLLPNLYTQIIVASPRFTVPGEHPLNVGRPRIG